MLPRFITYAIFYVVLTRFSIVDCGLEFQYHRNQELESILKGFMKRTIRPLRSDIYTIGKTALGNQLWVLRLTAANKSAIGTPNIKLIGNMHGNEAVGREILLHYIEHLIENYGKNRTITWLLNNTNIHILPSLNPDGYQNSVKGCESFEGRNVPPMEVDLNRNFPAFFHNNSKIIDWSVIESNAIRHWMENNTFILSAALHGGALVANYPFDIKEEIKSTFEKEPSYTPDDDVFRHLANTYAKNHPTMHLGHPCPDTDIKFEGGIVNGAMWYELEGGMGDYNYAFHGCMELTLEISCCKFPPEEDLPLLWEQNREALLQYCKQAHRGVSGQVLDYDSGLPITDANLTIVGRKMTFWSSRYTGEFWRILLPGKYAIQVEAEGYYSRKVPFTVPEYKNFDPKLTFLRIMMRNSSIHTTTTEVQSTKLELTTSASTRVPRKSPDLRNRFAYSDEESKENDTVPEIQVLMIVGRANVLDGTALKPLSVLGTLILLSYY